MAQIGIANVKLKAVTAIVINGGTHTNPTGEATESTPGTNILDFGTYIIGDTNPLAANATVYFDNLNLADQTLDISITPKTALRNSGGDRIVVDVSLSKNKIVKGDVTNNSAFINLHGVVPTPNTAITSAGEYVGTIAVTVAIN